MKSKSPNPESSQQEISCLVNGEYRKAKVHPLRRLLEVLREVWGLTGTKEGCGEGECGACAVLINGQLTNSCLVPAAQVNGQEVWTIEGAATKAEGRLFQERMVACGGVQCGMCTPGMVMAALEFALKKPQGGQRSPSESELRQALAGNLCRCTGYNRIVEALSQTCANDLSFSQDRP